MRLLALLCLIGLASAPAQAAGPWGRDSSYNQSIVSGTPTPAHVQGGANNVTGTPTSISLTLTAVGSGDTLCFYVFDASGTSTPGTLTDNKTGNTYTSTVTPATILGGFGYVFVAANVINAPTAFTYTTTEGASSNISIVGDEFSGTATSSVTDGSAIASVFGGSGTNGVITGSFTTAVNGDMIWGASLSFTATLLPGTSTLTYSAGVANGTFLLYSEYAIQATAGSGTKTSFTPSVSTNAQIVGVGLKP